MWVEGNSEVITILFMPIEGWIMLQGKTFSPFTVAVAAVFTAFVCVATMLFSIYVPSTEGFFNIGESMVFLSALLFGPFVGAFAGGVGSSLADLLLGYPHYAPATLVIKAREGYVVGVLNRSNPKFSSKVHWKSFTSILGVVAKKTPARDLSVDASCWVSRLYEKSRM